MGPGHKMAQDFKTSFEKLNRNNYCLWKKKAECVLIRDDTWCVIRDSVPNQPDAQWIRKDESARASIYLMIEDDLFGLIDEATTAKEAWQLLKTRFETFSFSECVFVMKKLCKMQLDDFHDMEQHINEIQMEMKKLASMGEKLGEKWEVAMILRSLPDSYDVLVTTLEASCKGVPSLTVVKEKLIEESKRRNQKKAFEDSALKVRGLPEKRLICFFCQKVGHIRKNCQEYQNFLKKKNKSNVVVADETVDGKDEICFCLGGENEDDCWYVDSGATSHICNRKDFFKSLDKQSPSTVTVANGYELKAYGKGTCEINVINGKGVSQNVLVKDVLYVPKIESNLLSVKKLTKRGFKIDFYDDLCEIWYKNEIVATATAVSDKDLYKVKTSAYNAVNEQAMIVNQKRCVHYWHRALGHRDIGCVKKILSSNNENVDECSCDDLCEICIRGKLSRKSFPKNSNQQSKDILDLIHSDVCGPMDTQTPGGKIYFVTFIDDFSKYITIYLLNHKSEVVDKMKEYCEMVNTKFGRYPKIIRSDRGGEYTSSAIKNFCHIKGIKQQFTAPYTPEQNGVAERRNRYLLEMVRCMLLDSDMSKCYWGEAVVTAAFIQNHLTTRSTNKIPIEIWEGKQANKIKFEIFGSLSLVHIPKEKRKKLDQKAKYLIFVGYSEESKAFRFLDKNTNRITISRDYKILHEKCPNKNNLKNLNNDNNVYIDLLSFKNNHSFSNNNDILPNVQDQNMNIIQINDDDNEEFFDSENAHAEDSEEVEIHNISSEDQFPNSENENASEDIEVLDIIEASSDNQLTELDIEEPPPALRQSTRSTKGKIPERFQMIVATDLKEPKTFNEVLKRNDKDKWMDAMKNELNSLAQNGTWELVDIPEGRKPIGCKWVFKIKTDADGRITKYKARLVAQGFSQKFGVDYDEVFAPVVRQTTFRMFLTLAGEKQLTIKQYDIKTAFLYGNLKEEIYMKQPVGFEVPNNKFCKLKKSIYGLKQSAKCWNEKLINVFLNVGFSRGLADSCVLKILKDGEWIFLLIYVDDILVAANSENHHNFVKLILKNNFDISDMGEVNFYLGIKIEKGIDKYFTISQENYINKIVEDSGVTDAKFSKIPMDIGYVKENDDNNFMPSNEKYHHLIGSLLYLSVNTRPDISTAVSILSRKVNNPTFRDWAELKRLIKYLNGTKELKLKLTCNNKKGLYGFADADWAQCQADRKSNSGFLFKYNGSCISWCCRKQECVSLSSTEAEYISLSEASQEAVWLRRLMNDFEVKLNHATVIYEDNQSCLKLIENEKFSRRTKHIETKYNFVRDLKSKDILDFKYCPTDQMEADMMTKPLQATKIKQFRELIGLMQS